MTDFISIKMKTDGKLKRIVTNLKNLDDKAMSRVAQQVHRELKKEITTQKLVGKTGQLRKTTTVQKVKRLHYRIGPTRDYAKWVNYGTGIFPPGGKGEFTAKDPNRWMHWVDKHGEEHFAKVVLGQPARHYMGITRARCKPQINRWYNKFLMVELNRILKGGGQMITMAEVP